MFKRVLVRGAPSCCRAKSSTWPVQAARRSPFSYQKAAGPFLSVLPSLRAGRPQDGHTCPAPPPGACPQCTCPGRRAPRSLPPVGLRWGACALLSLYVQALPLLLPSVGCVEGLAQVRFMSPAVCLTFWGGSFEGQVVRHCPRPQLRSCQLLKG